MVEFRLLGDSRCLNRDLPERDSHLDIVIGSFGDRQIVPTGSVAWTQVFSFHDPLLLAEALTGEPHLADPSAVDLVYYLHEATISSGIK